MELDRHVLESGCEGKGQGWPRQPVKEQGGPPTSPLVRCAGAGLQPEEPKAGGVGTATVRGVRDGMDGSATGPRGRPSLNPILRPPEHKLKPTPQSQRARRAR